MQKPILAVFCTLLCLIPLFSFSVVCAMNNSLPSTFHVTFQGYMQQPSSSSGSSSSDAKPSLVLQFLNGTQYMAETTDFTFSLDESSKGEYTAKFTLTFGDFYDEVSLPANVLNGRVFIDSVPTIFVVNPDSLIDDSQIQIFQTENLSLSGTVRGDGRPSTLIDDYHVLSKVVQASYQQANSGMFVSSPILTYDAKTGVLTSATGQFSDVLLNKLGVSFIFGGLFDLEDYSESLNFTLVNLSPPIWQFIIIPVAIILFVLVVFLAYRSSKKKKSGKRKTYSERIFFKKNSVEISKRGGRLWVLKLLVNLNL
jgi:hypothetical protein